MRPKIRFASDFDDVLLHLIPALIAFHNDTYGSQLKYDQFHSLKFWEVWGGTREQAIPKVAAFYNTDYFRNMQPVEHSQYAVHQLSSQAELLAIFTARQLSASQCTHEQISTYFPSLFPVVEFCNHFSKEGGSSISKKELCDRHDITHFIDDSYEHALNCLDPNRKVFLMNRPWNKDYETHHGIIRVDNWLEVLDAL